MKVDFEHWKGSEIADQILRNEQDREWLQIIESLNPTFSKDGDQFCFLYGSLPNDCVVGFGNTPKEAMIDFCRNFTTGTTK